MSNEEDLEPRTIEEIRAVCDIVFGDALPDTMHKRDLRSRADEAVRAIRQRHADLDDRIGGPRGAASTFVAYDEATSLMDEQGRRGRA